MSDDQSQIKRLEPTDTSRATCPVGVYVRALIELGKNHPAELAELVLKHRARAREEG